MTLNIPQDFLSHGEDAWKEAVAKALKGAPMERLFGKTEDGLEIAPLYNRRPDAAPKLSRPARQPWTVFQRIDHPDIGLANRQILEDLEGGANGLELVFPTSLVAARGQGLQVDTLADLEKLLAGVYPELVKWNIGGGYAGAGFLAMFCAYLEKIGTDPAQVTINLGTDPISSLASRGKLNIPLSEHWRRGRDTILGIQSIGAKACFFSADGRIWHNSGGSHAQELAYTMASLITFLRVLEDSKIAPELWSDHLSLTLVAEEDQIGTIAKIRAARRLWAAVLDACGLEQTPINIHMQTSYRMLTNVDPWVNLLRNTVATFAAGVGGADGLTVLPHTKSIGLPDAFARRLARNTQTILIEESNLHMVSDPSAGSGAIEARTDDLCARAWELIQEVEAAGGIVESLVSGKVQERIIATRDARNLDVARRKRPITGVSEFPFLTEKRVAVLDVEYDELEGLVEPLDIGEPGEGERFLRMRKVFADGYGLGNVLHVGLSPSPAVTATRLDMLRISQPYEKLRDAADTAAGGAPTIFLACLGSLSQFTARATWVANAFAAGGIGNSGGDAVDSLDQLVSHWRAAGTDMACLVSSDAVYAEQAEDAARALKAAGAKHIYLAGKPGDQEDALKAAGVDTFIYAGCNLLDLLREAYAREGLVIETEASS